MALFVCLSTALCGRRLPDPMRLHPLALAASLIASGSWAQSPPSADAAGWRTLQPSPALRGLPRSGAAAEALPTFIEADRLHIQPDVEAVAEGTVVFRRGGLTVRADRIRYDAAQDTARATGSVKVVRDGARYSSPEALLQVQRFQGWLLEPIFDFPAIGAGGRAQRVDILDSSRVVATQAEYTSCPREDGVAPAWVLKTDRVQLDVDAGEGRAEGAVLRFLDVPILALPALSFALADTRRSGWLPPTIDSNNRSGLQLAVPWYWNIAPNRDATFTPRVLTRRGVGLNGEFRYLEPHSQGTLAVDWLPQDRVWGGERHAVQWLHETRGPAGVRFNADVSRVSDDDWWKDFPTAARGYTQRLLPLRLGAERPFEWGDRVNGTAYARVVRWQPLQGTDSVLVSPFERAPQVGLKLGQRSNQGWNWAVESEFNRFTLPNDPRARDGREGGSRVHLLGQVAYAWREPGWFFTPRLSINSAAYSGGLVRPDGSSSDRAQRTIPTFSLDGGLELDRETQAFGRAFRQTLEPRLYYVQTPYRAQSHLPNYDAAARDFNFSSIYSDNSFTGIDRVADADQLTAGITTRFVDSSSGAEALRLGVVQRYQFRAQQITAQANGMPDGPPRDQRLSDLLLLGSTNLVPSWTLDAAVQYNPDSHRSVRSKLGARYSPGPFRTVSATYRFTRGLTEQLELGWQWPIWSRERQARSERSENTNCSGSWYAVGRVNYSLKDSRVTDAIIGTEYDAGCWIGRVVFERLSTGRSQATTRYMVQLELVGLSRIGSNPLRALKDNIPGYRLLRDERRPAAGADDRTTVSAHD